MNVEEGEREYTVELSEETRGDEKDEAVRNDEEAHFMAPFCPVTA